MVTLLLDHKADPRCLNNLGVLLTCLFFILPSLKTNILHLKSGALEKEVPDLEGIIYNFGGL